VLIDASVRGLAPGYYTDAQIASALRYMFGVDTQLVDDGTYFLFEHEGSPVACGGWSGRQTLFGGDRHKVAAGASDRPVDPATAPARIRAFFVHPDWARRGLGTRLAAQCEAEAHAAGFRALELMGTLPGVPLYRHLGFTTLAPVDVQLPDGVTIPCQQMRRELAPSVERTIGHCGPMPKRP
jgi:GNAT superfamily N-acetyltransferase